MGWIDLVEFYNFCCFCRTRTRYFDVAYDGDSYRAGRWLLSRWTRSASSSRTGGLGTGCAHETNEHEWHASESSSRKLFFWRVGCKLQDAGLCLHMARWGAASGHLATWINQFSACWARPTFKCGLDSDSVVHTHVSHSICTTCWHRFIIYY